ncbi:hypothetical protein ACTDI4_15010 [Mesorhizobium sp. PUT5]|jgi:hypothetical protein|uniref:hypothetical protein n=1 Tax=Mesorhizobium sp. PUT5 TaxID=3454629 RepID=UPI003FA48968
MLKVIALDAHCRTEHFTRLVLLINAISGRMRPSSDGWFSGLTLNGRIASRGA